MHETFSGTGSVWEACPDSDIKSVGSSKDNNSCSSWQDSSNSAQAFGGEKQEKCSLTFVIRHSSHLRTSLCLYSLVPVILYCENIIAFIIYSLVCVPIYYDDKESMDTCPKIYYLKSIWYPNLYRLVLDMIFNIELNIIFDYSFVLYYINLHNTSRLAPNGITIKI